MYTINMRIMIGDQAFSFGSVLYARISNVLEIGKAGRCEVELLPQ